MHECLPAIEDLGRCKMHKVREHILKDGKVVDALSEGSLSVLLGNVPLSTAKYNKLRNYKNELQLLSNKRTARKRKRAVLLQDGGGLITLLASVLIPTLVGLLSK